jgi:hypothetical protein
MQSKKHALAIQEYNQELQEKGASRSSSSMPSSASLCCTNSNVCLPPLVSFATYVGKRILRCYQKEALALEIQNVKVLLPSSTLQILHLSGHKCHHTWRRASSSPLGIRTRQMRSDILPPNESVILFPPFINPRTLPGDHLCEG